MILTISLFHLEQAKPEALLFMDMLLDAGQPAHDGATHVHFSTAAAQPHCNDLPCL
jgi:hypothetical protein